MTGKRYPYILKPYRREDITTISITYDLKAKLADLGIKGESYNAIVLRLYEANIRNSNEYLKKEDEPIIRTKLV